MIKAKPKTIGDRIKAARQTYRMSQQQLSENLDLTRAAVSLYEQDRIRPRDEVVLRLAAIFNTPPEWFAYGRGNPPTSHDVPVDIPEIDLARYTGKVADLRSLKTGRFWRLPTMVFEEGLAISPDHMLAMAAPTDVPPVVKTGDRVVVDLHRRTGPAGVYLVVDPQKGACLRHYWNPHPSGPDIVGRVVAYLRSV